MSALSRLLVVLLAVLGLHSGGSAGRVPGAGRVPSDVRSITIHNDVGVSVAVTKPADVAAIVRWFDALPRFVARPCPKPLRTPPKVRFVFRGPHGSLVMRATARRPGTCSGEVTYTDIGQVKHAPLAGDGLVARVSKLLGVSFDPNARTDENRQTAEDSAATLRSLVSVPAGSRPLAKPKRPRLFRGYAMVEARGAWQVHLPFAYVVAFEKAHPPHGSSGTSSYVESYREYSDTITLQFRFPPLAHRVVSRAIDIEIDALPGGWTKIGVAAFGRWIVARSINEKVPAGVREIVFHPFSGHVRRITRPDQVFLIAHWINSLPVTQPIFPVCNLPVVSTLRRAAIEFLGAGGTTLATASAVGSGPCYPLWFSRDRQRGVSLPNGWVLRRIEQLTRPPVEKVPTGVTQIVFRSHLITDRVKVAEIVHLFEALPRLRPGVIGTCTRARTIPPVRLDFRDSAGTLLARAQLDVYYRGFYSDRCAPIEYSIGGHVQTPVAGGYFFRRVERLLR